MSPAARAVTSAPSTVVVALTGGVASGKSEVSRRFAQLSVPIFDADLIARELVVAGQPALTEIVAAFGQDALTSAGALDRKRLRERIFADPPLRLRLEAILHPRVRAELLRHAQGCTAAYCILAIPLLAEHIDDYRWIDRALVIDVAVQTQLDRLMQRDAMTPAAARRMLAAQVSRQERLAIADDVIDNEGPLENLGASVARLDRYYRSAAARSGLIDPTA